jgi:fibronectin-binding autotransporter adhesin
MKPLLTRGSLARPIPIALASAFLSTLSHVHAQVSNFTTTPNSDYATPANWSGGLIPGNGNNEEPRIGVNNTASAIYSTATGYSTPSRFIIGLGNPGIASLTLNGSAGTLAFGGDSFGLANYVGVDGGTGTLTINAGTISLTNGANAGGHLFVGANAGGTLSTGTVVVNPGGTLNAGTRILLGVNRAGNSGTLTINGGSVVIGSGTSADADRGHLYMANTSGNATLNLDGGTLSLSRFNTSGGGANTRTINFNGGTIQARVNDATFLTGTLAGGINAGGAIFDTNGFNITVSSPLLHHPTLGATPDGGLTKNGAGTLTLSSNASTFTGNVAVNGGTLSLAAGFNNPTPTNSAIGNALVARTVTVSSGAILEFAANDVLGNAAALPQLTLVANGGTIQSNGTKFSTLGALQLNGGTLAANNGVNGTYQAWSLTNTVTVGGNAPSTISTTGTNSGIHLGSSLNNIITFNVADATGSAATDLLVSAPLINRNTGQGGGTGGLLKAGAGTMTLVAANSYTGPTTVAAGTLEFAGAGTTSTASAITVQNGGTLRFSRNDTWGNAGTLVTAPITIDAGGVVQSNDTFNALVNLTLNGGTLSANDGVNANFPTFGLKGTVTANATAGGSTISTTGVGNFNTIAIGTGGAGGTTTFAVADGAAASDLTVSVPLSNLAGQPSGLIKTGLGTMTLTAANTYTGTTTINGGVLAIGPGGTISTLSTISVNNTGTLRFARNDTWGNHTTDISSPIIVNAGGTLQTGGFFNTIRDLTLNGGTVAMTGGVNAGFPALALKGTVTVGGSQASQINVVSGNFNAINIGDDNLGATIFNVADATGNPSPDLIVNAALQNNALANANSITKTGAGTMELTAASTYTGTTTVSAGTLLVNNATGSATGTSAVIVSGNGATLGGAGRIAPGAAGLSILSGGTLSPGNSPDSLTVNGNVLFGPGSSFDLDLAIGGVAGLGDGTSGTDRLIVQNGSVNITGGELIGTWGGSPANIFAGTADASNMLWAITGAAALNGTFANTAEAPGYTPLFGATPHLTSIDGQAFAVFYGANFLTSSLTSGNDLLLIAVPEPSRALFLALAPALLLLRRRRNF